MREVVKIDEIGKTELKPKILMRCSCTQLNICLRVWHFMCIFVSNKYNYLDF